MNKIKKYFLNLWYGLPFGLKAAGKEIMGGGDEDQAGTEINQQVTDKRVAKHLLKGEVTQEVEELRYRTYKVSNESENYSYLGNGVAIKTEEKDYSITEKDKYKFSQENKIVCTSVLEEMNHVNNYGTERYVFECTYDGLVKFKIEQFATSVDVNINNKEKIIETTLRFEKQANPYNAKSKPFINQLAALKDVKSEYELKRNEIASSLETFSFSTYKAKNENDFVSYAFIGGGKFVRIEETELEYLITYSWNEYIRVPLNLEEKYYSKTMDEKYQNKERKDVIPEMVESERKAYCSICGKEVSIYDADILEASGQPVICKECMDKVFKNEKK
jgi:hypothetical protein